MKHALPRPEAAGITALVNQGSKHPAGFLNKALYKLGKQGTLQGVTHDVADGALIELGIVALFEEFEAHRQIRVGFVGGVTFVMGNARGA